MAAGVTVAVCSTSNEKAVQRIVDVMLGPEIAKSMRVFAGDVVAKKKPAPDIYLLAAKELSLDPARSAAPVLPADPCARLIFGQPQPRSGTGRQTFVLCRCVVIEDSNIGVEAAKAAGMR